MAGLLLATLLKIIFSPTADIKSTGLIFLFGRLKPQLVICLFQEDEFHNIQNFLIHHISFEFKNLNQSNEKI